MEMSKPLLSSPGQSSMELSVQSRDERSKSTRDEVISDRDIRLSAIGEKPQRPDKPKHVHEEQCDDKYRVSFCGHDWHWSEMTIVILLVVTTILACVEQFVPEDTVTTQNTTSVLTQKQQSTSAFWLVCILSAVFGNIFLWDIAWVESDAKYSAKIHEACSFIEDENKEMSLAMERLQKNCAIQKDLATEAAKQTAGMASEVGLVDAKGKLIKSNLKKFENIMDSAAFTGYRTRMKRVTEVQTESNFTNQRDNYYNDCIRSFKAATRGGSEASVDLSNERVITRLKKTFKSYNAKCQECKSEPVDIAQLDQFDADGDHKVGLWEFCVGIYHAILQREIGAEARKIGEMEEENKRMKKRIDEINAALGKISEGEPVGEGLLEEEFDIQTNCVVFAKPPSE